MYVTLAAVEAALSAENVRADARERIMSAVRKQARVPQTPAYQTYAPMPPARQFQPF
jgi:hypothetical protein